MTDFFGVFLIVGRRDEPESPSSHLITGHCPSVTNRCDGVQGRDRSAGLDSTPEESVGGREPQSKPHWKESGSGSFE